MRLSGQSPAQRGEQRLVGQQPCAGNLRSRPVFVQSADRFIVTDFQETGVCRSLMTAAAAIYLQPPFVFKNNCLRQEA